MSSIKSVVIFVAGTWLLAGCKFDLSVPDPQRGRVIGSIDTQSRLPLEGQTVTLSSDKGDRRTQLTDANGAFVFSDLPPGLVLVSLALPGFAKLSSELTTVSSGQDSDVGVLAPDWLQNTPSAGSIAGKVSANGGGDVSGAKVEFLLAGSVIDQLTVGADGLFVKPLPPGTFVLRASHPAFVSASLMDVTLLPGATLDLTTTPLVLDINPATLTGIVFKERDQRQPGPAAGALITLDSGQTTTVDAAGNFQLTGLAAGNRQMRVTLPGFHDAAVSRLVRLDPGATTMTDKVTLLIDRGSVVGTVKLADNAPVSGARVELANGYATLVSPNATDPSQGDFVIQNVPAGMWGLTARKEQYSIKSITVTVEPGASVNSGVLILSRLFGDFSIDDADPLNTAGYTRTSAVTLDFARFPPTGVASFRASEDSSFDGGVFLPYSSPLQPFTLQAGEGAHTVYAQYQDTNGQVSQTLTSTVVLDTIRPTTPSVTFESTGSNGPARFTNRAQDLPLQIVAFDDLGSGLALMKVGESLDGLGNVGQPPAAYRLTALLRRSSPVDGPQRVYVQVIDNAGNVSVAGNDSIVVDTAAPTGNITVLRGIKATDDGYTGNALVTIEETWSDGTDGGVVLIKLANASGDLGASVYQPAANIAAWFINPNGDGLKTVSARFRDLAGNESANPATATITYDTIAPTPAAASLLTPAVTRNPVVNLSLTTNTADLSTMKALALSAEATFTSAGPSVAFPMSAEASFTLPPGDGVRTLYVRYTDRAGNDAFTSVSVTLDTAPPLGSFTVTGALGDGTRSTTLTSSTQVTVSLVPGGATEYRLGDETMTSCPSTGYTPIVSPTLTNQPLAASGVMTLCLRDAAGNLQHLQQSLTVDAVPPANCALTLSGKRVDGAAAPAGLTAVTSITGAVTCAEQPAEVHLASAPVTCSNLNGASLNWQPWSSVLPVTLAPGDGSRAVFGCVRDAARNVAAFTLAAITLDTSGPSPATATLVGASPTNQGSVTLTLAASDLNGLSTTDAVTAAEDLLFTGAGTVGPSGFPGTSQVSLPLSAGDGAKVIYVRFRDRVGNASLVAIPVEKDQAPPTGSIVVRGALADGTPSTDWATSTAVTVLLTHTGASSYFLGDESLGTTCPTTGYTAITTSSIASTLTGAASPRSVRICLRDAATNIAGPFEDTIPLDTAGPANCAFTLAGRRVDGSAATAGFTAQTDITATVANCTAPGPTEVVVSTTSITCSAAASLPWQPFSPSSLVSLAAGNGARSVFGCGRDAARNVTAISTGTITLDTTPPSPASATLLTANPTNLVATNLQLTASDTNGLGATDAVTASQDLFFATGLTGPSAFPVSSQLAFTLTGGDGAKNVYVRFRDAVGNEVVSTVNVTLDATAPTGSLVIQGALADGAPSTITTSTNTVTLLITQTGATQYLVGNEALTSCPAAGYSPLTGNSVGYVMTSALPSRVVNLCLRDAAGNVSALITGTIPFDAAGPPNCAVSLTGTMVDGGVAPVGKTANTTVTAAVAGCTETPTEIYLTPINTACSSSASYPWQSFALSQSTVVGGPDGVNTLYGCVRDATRNVGSLVPGTILLDRQGPTAAGVVIEGGAAFINAATVATNGGNIGSVNGSAQTAVLWTVSENPAAFPAVRALGGFNFTFAGTGPRTVYAKFMDDLGNESTVVTDGITIDVVAPDVTATSWAFLAPQGAAPSYTNNRVLSFSLTNAPADGAGVQVTQSGSCVSGSFAGVPVVPPTNPFSITLTGADGVWPVCARIVDAAGNGSSALVPITVILDRLAPTAPNIVTLPRLLNATAPAGFAVATSGPVTDANFDRYERSGGTASSWVSNGTTDLAISSTSFGYTLQPNKANVLRLRAVDRAGNVSPEDSVSVTWDTVPPQALGLRDFWVDNSSGRSTFHWTTTSDLDVVSYKIYYGPIPGSTAPFTRLPLNFNGTNAVEGASPITVSAITGLDQSLALTGLTNGSQVYATVTALDAAGNEGPAPLAGPQLTNFYVALEPNEVSMNRIARLTLPGAGEIEAISIRGDRAYVVGRTNSGCVAGSATLTVVDLNPLSAAISQGHPDLSPPTPVIRYGPITFPDVIGCTVSNPQRPLLVDVLADGPYLFMASGNNVRIFSLANPDLPSLMAGSPITLANPVQQLNLVGDRLFVTGDPHVTAINLVDLYDNAVATTVTTADVIGTALPNIAGPWWATGSTITRDRLIEFTGNGGTTYNFLLDNALAAAPSFTTAAASVAVTGNYVDSFSTVRHVTGGNYLYFSSNSAWTVYRLANLWGSTTAGPGLVGTADQFRQIQTVGGEGNTVVGNQAFVLSGTSLRTIDMTLASAMYESSVNTFDSSVRSVTQYGDYLIVGGDQTLHFFELATPRSMRQVASGQGGGPFADVGPGFLYSGMGRVHDLHVGPVMAPTVTNPIAFGTLDDVWAYDMARFGDRMIAAEGTGFIIFNVEDASDRTSSTVFDMSDTTTVMLPAGRRVTGVEAWGNYLVAAELRADGLWVEVFDARPLRNPNVVFNATTHSRGAFRVAAFAPSATLWAAITMHHGRAVISLDDNATPAPTPGVYVVDVRSLMDDVVGGTPTVLASLALTAVQETEVRGGWLYAAANGGVTVVDIKETMTEPPTALPGSPTSVVLPGGSSGSLEVFGSHLYTVARIGQSIRAVDVRNPTMPRVLSQVALPNITYGGTSTLEVGSPIKTFRRGLIVRGTRLYYTHYDEVRVIELE